MPAVYWGWHMVDGGAVANAVQNFQHWAIRVGDKWYENDNTGSNATGKPYVVNTLSQSEVQDQLKNRERMAPMKTKKLGESNATEAQITAWMDEYKKGRTYNITASLSWPPSASEKQIGNCQTMGALPPSSSCLGVLGLVVVGLRVWQSVDYWTSRFQSFCGQLSAFPSPLWCFSLFPPSRACLPPLK